MGVSTNPEICDECRSTLRLAYAFRKKCLATENLIGTFLIKSRCNAASIELIDVLIFLEQQRKEQRNTETSTSNTQAEIISEWDDDVSQDSEEPNKAKNKVSLICNSCLDTLIYG